MQIATDHHRWPVWHGIGRLLGAGLRVVPQRLRFRFAIRVAQAIAPVVAFTDMYARNRRAVQTLEEITLFQVLNMMTRSGTTFDMDTEIDGLADLQRSIGHGQGVFIAAMHAVLNHLIIRQLHDLGCNPQIVAVDTKLRIPGTPSAGNILAPLPGYMLRLRSWLSRGGISCAMIDRRQIGRRTVDVDTCNGPVIFAHSLFRVAELANAVVFFVHVGLRGGKVRVTFRRAGDRAEVVPAPRAARLFARFVQAQVPQAQN